MVTKEKAQSIIMTDRAIFSVWSQQGMILRPPDYESGATNQLSYGTVSFCVFCVYTASDFASSGGHYLEVTPFLLTRLPCLNTKSIKKCLSLSAELPVRKIQRTFLKFTEPPFFRRLCKDMKSFWNFN